MKYWERLTDEQLLAAELYTDDPESLERLVREVPAGEEESYVEFAYDLGGSGREMLHCVHGNHAHLKGFVMRKGEHRFLVGHVCGEMIYGERWDGYTSDFSTAINRRNVLLRRREIGVAADPFLAWLRATAASTVFGHYRSIRGRIKHHVPWIIDGLPRVLATTHTGVVFPRRLFVERPDPQLTFDRTVAELEAAIEGLSRAPDAKAVMLFRIIEHALRRVDSIIDDLEEVVDLFQPKLLTALCALANEHDNPARRHYTPGVLRFTVKRHKRWESLTLELPRNYGLPDRRIVEEFRAAMKGLPITAKAA